MPSVELDELRRHWDQFGLTDPMWAILTHPAMRFGRWDPEEFFEAGRSEIGTILALVERSLNDAGMSRHPGGRALDFGCGLGRLAQALCDHYDHVDGVDIAPSMIEGARRWNRHGDRCRYHLNTTGDLSLFGAESFQFVYTAHVLQHMEPRFARGYVEEFLRVLAPGGLVLFETVTEPAAGADEPLPAAAFRASVTLPSARLECALGEGLLLPVRVSNDSPCTWPASGTGGWFLVTVGNHWLSAGGKRLAVDDGRVRLPADVPPGGSVTVELEISPPATPGDYLCEVDLVQEGVSWFADQGSATATAHVTVGPRRRAEPSAGRVVGRLLSVLGRVQPFGLRRGAGAIRIPPGDEPIMEMYGTPEAEIAEWIDQAGGRLLSVANWDEIFASRSYDWQRRAFLAVKQ